MSFGGTPIEDYDFQVEQLDFSTSYKKNTITVDRKDLDKAMEAVIKKISKTMAYDFATKFRENIIFQLKAMSHKGETYGPSLREQIIKSITDVELEKSGSKMSYSFEITHGLAKALNDGTGIHGDKHQMITPTNRKYMFIPGEQYFNRAQTPGSRIAAASKRQAQRFASMKGGV